MVLAYPLANAGVQSSLAWQAVTRMAYTQNGISGPQGIPFRSGTAAPGIRILNQLSLSIGLPPTGGAGEFDAVRHTLHVWGTTTVVVSRQVGPRLIGQGRDASFAAAFLTGALGTRPLIESDAWVWRDVGHAPAPLRLPPDAVFDCWSANRRAPADTQPSRAHVRARRGTLSRRSLRCGRPGTR